MGRTKEATVLVDRVGAMHGFKKLVNNDFVFGKNRIVIRSAEPEVDNGYNRYFLGVTVPKLQEVPPDQIYLLLVLGDEDKIIYLPGDVALKLFENVPLVSKDQVKFSVWERGSYYALSATGIQNVVISQYFNASPWPKVKAK